MLSPGVFAERGTLTPLPLGSLWPPGEMKFAGFLLFEAPEAGLAIDCIVRLGQGILITGF